MKQIKILGGYFIPKKLKPLHPLSDKKDFNFESLVSYGLFTNKSHPYVLKQLEPDEYGYYKYDKPYKEINNGYIHNIGMVFNSQKKLLSESFNTYYDTGGGIWYSGMFCKLYKSTKFKRYIAYINYNLGMHLSYNFYARVRKNHNKFLYKLFILEKKCEFYFLTRLIFRKTRLINTNDDKKYVLFYDFDFKNFTHFLYEAFPRLYGLMQYANEEEKKEFIFILPIDLREGIQDKTSFQWECLQSLNISETQLLYLDDGKLLKAKNILFLEQIKFSPTVYDAIQHLVSYYKNDADIKKYQKYKRIYLQRNPEDSRKVENKSELSAMCAKYDIHEVVIGKLSLKEKINLLQNTELVVSSYGSEAANVCFADNKKATALYLTSPHMDFFFSALFQTFNINYIINQSCKVLADKNKWYNSDSNFNINITKLEALIEKVVSKT